MTSTSKIDLLEKLFAEYSKCRACELGRRTPHKVYGCGNPNAEIMFIGIAPREDEEAFDHPFSGSPGNQLDRILRICKLDRNKVYTTNLVLCRPFESVQEKRTKKMVKKDRDPTKLEAVACMERLKQEIYIVDPLVLVLCGKPPVANLANKNADMANMRGQVIQIRVKQGDPDVYYPAVPTWNPEYLVQKNTNLTGDPVHQAWIDLKKACRIAERIKQERSKFTEETDGIKT